MWKNLRPNVGGVGWLMDFGVGWPIHRLWIFCDKYITYITMCFASKNMINMLVIVLLETYFNILN